MKIIFISKLNNDKCVHTDLSCVWSEKKLPENNNNVSQGIMVGGQKEILTITVKNVSGGSYRKLCGFKSHALARV